MAGWIQSMHCIALLASLLFLRLPSLSDLALPRTHFSVKSPPRPAPSSSSPHPHYTPPTHKPLPKQNNKPNTSPPPANSSQPTPLRPYPEEAVPRPRAERLALAVDAQAGDAVLVPAQRVRGGLPLRERVPGQRLVWLPWLWSDVWGDGVERGGVGEVTRRVCAVVTGRGHTDTYTHTRAKKQQKEDRTWQSS
jgi:hypothetical protein